MRQVLTQEFFQRPVLEVAPDLLGKFLVCRKQGNEYAYMITEVEAYDGEDDQACHGSRGRTQRTEPMYGPAGHLYVYLIYGMYWMLNIVTGPKNYPAAVLIRGVEGMEGPGILTRETGIDKRFNGKKADPITGLWIEERGVTVEEDMVSSKPRIGVSYAGPWAEKPWNFSLFNG